MTKKLLERLSVIENDIQWLKKILIGAAALGFFEKLIGWLWK